MLLRHEEANTQLEGVDVLGLVQMALTSRLDSYEVVLSSFGTLTVIGLRLSKRPKRGLDVRQRTRERCSGRHARALTPRYPAEARRNGASASRG